MFYKTCTSRCRTCFQNERSEKRRLARKCKRCNISIAEGPSHVFYCRDCGPEVRKEVVRKCRAKRVDYKPPVHETPPRPRCDHCHCTWATVPRYNYTTLCISCYGRYTADIVRLRRARRGCARRNERGRDTAARTEYRSSLERLFLADTYVERRICTDLNLNSKKDVPTAFIELKRQLLAVRRKLYNEKAR
jgi:hypothetical protein